MNQDGTGETFLLMDTEVGKEGEQGERRGESVYWGLR